MSEIPAPIPFHQTQTEFYARVGFCISRWAYIERELFALSKWALGANDVVATFVFYQWASFENKLSYVDGLLKRTAASELKIQWKALLSRIKTAASDRNFIVHQPPSQYTHGQIKINIDTGETISAQFAPTEWYIRTESLEIQAGKRKERKISSLDLKSHITEIDDLYGLLIKFRKEAVNSPRRFSKSAPQAEPPRSGRAKNRRANSQAQKRPPRPSQA